MATTDPAIKDLAETALSILDRKGTRQDGGRNFGDSTWVYATKTPEGMRYGISCTGPDLPAFVPAEKVFPADIPADLEWVGVYRLVIAPPLVAFDISWRPDEPLRIMTFSRGDWEAQLGFAG